MRLKRPRVQSESEKVAARGIHTASEFAGLMSCLLADLARGTITPQLANAMCNAAGKLLRLVEIQQRFGAGHQNYEMLLAPKNERT